MTRRNAAPNALVALFTLLLAVLAHCQAPVFAAVGEESSAGGTSQVADLSPEIPGESEPTDEPGSSASPANSSQDEPDLLDKPPPSRKGGKPNSPPTAQAPPTGDRLSSAPTGDGGSATSPAPGAPLLGPTEQCPAPRPAVLQVFRL